MMSMAARPGIVGETGGWSQRHAIWESRSMGRDPGSEAYSSDSESRLSSLYSFQPREGSTPDSLRREDIIEEAESFESFAQSIREELAPRGRLQRVLADRVILSAWTLHEAGLAELRSIRDLSSCEPPDDPGYASS